MSDSDLPANLPGQPDHRYTNRLIDETSPYLLQHAHNPVDWYPWGAEALERSRTEDKPILLSVGYSACHWCHVMEHESFENERIATIMNLNFVPIKVDREERPDIDALYMDAVQAMTSGHGGWPMTVFLTPEGLPFYAGTYFPAEDKHGLPGFDKVLLRMAQYYRTQRTAVNETAEEFRTFYQQRGTLAAVGVRNVPMLASEVDISVLTTAEGKLLRQFDATYGGFGGAPKFPHSLDLDFLLRMHLRAAAQPARAERFPTLGSKASQPDVTALAVVTRTLDRMAAGGIYDHLGGGFHRYSVDDHWLVPHFEKMLYDNALLARTYLHAYQVTGNARYARICRETLDYIRRQMTSPEGGFYATQDADSEGQEGKFYVWSPEELREVLDDDHCDLFMAVYGVTERGNFEDTGATVLHLARSVADAAAERGLSVEAAEKRLADARMALYAARSRRVWPATDDKIVTAWNGLMVRVFAEAAAVFNSQTYAEVAANNATFIWEHLRTSNGRLLRTYRDGKAHVAGYLEDYACYAAGLLATYEATFDARWFVAARELADQMISLFADADEGGFYDTASDHEQLVGRPREIADGATPAGNSVAAEVLLWLAALTGEERYRHSAEGILLKLAPQMAQNPLGYGNWLCQLDRWMSPSQEIAIVGDPAEQETLDLIEVTRARYRPNTVIACAAPDDLLANAAISLLTGRPSLEGFATAYVCANFTCNLPVTDATALAEQLGDE
ncbi:MAG: thioredoxin domain-containing protein [Ktedonobacterales bacterium]|nr:thioredoxin domain-containing protein [Ktedonobacterales bacterium]